MGYKCHHEILKKMENDKNPEAKVTLKSRLDAKHLPAYLPEEATAEDKKAKFSNIIVDGENDVTFTSSWPRIRLTTTFHQKFL